MVLFIGSMWWGLFAIFASVICLGSPPGAYMLVTSWWSGGSFSNLLFGVLLVPAALWHGPCSGFCPSRLWS